MKRLLARLLVLPLVALAALAAVNVSAAPDRVDQAIVLPGASSAEGIAIGSGNVFYAGDLFSGDIYRGDIQKGNASLFIDAPTGRMAAGMKVDQSTDQLFVAGGPTGQAYVYDLRTHAPLASYQFGAPGVAFINDVAITKDG